MREVSFSLSELLGDHPDKYPRQLAERYPRIADRIAQQWFDAIASEAYFAELMIADRTDRQGFEPEIAHEIMMLSLAYDTIRQRQVKARGDVWEMERAQKALDQLGMRMNSANFARAVDTGDHALCMLFINAGFDVNSRDSRNWTPLMVATFNGREDLALELIKHGANIHATDNDGYTPMHWAAYNDYAKVITRLVNRGADVNVKSRAGITPLLQAASRGKLQACLELLNQGANPNAAAADGSTPLLKAVANAQLPVINILLAANANLNVRLVSGKSLLEIASASRDDAVSKRIATAAAAAAARLKGLRARQQ
jgi:ankyrin repeat protein